MTPVHKRLVQFLNREVSSGEDMPSLLAAVMVEACRLQAAVLTGNSLKPGLTREQYLLQLTETMIKQINVFLADMDTIKRRIEPVIQRISDAQTIPSTSATNVIPLRKPSDPTYH